MRKSTLLRQAALVLFVFLFFSGCQREISYDLTNVTPIIPPDLSTKVNSSVSGFVTDENNQPVLNATVQIGSSNITTDKYGFFETRNVSVIKNAATVTVSKTGYFKGIKTYTATEGKNVFFRIKLIPKSNCGTINGGSGGTVTLSNGMVILLPANAVVNAVTNAPYTGTVNVAAYWINPTSNELSSIMPGDLRGITTEGSLKFLASYGMAAVELTGTGGELLQIAATKKASLTMPVPPSIVATAPSTIPLWYFDEIKGLWKQEGIAVKTGNNYVGDVSHFSFWNCDVPESYVRFDCTLVDAAGQTIPYAFVRATAVSSGVNFSDYGYTDSSGYVSGYVPDNAQIKLEVFDNSNCTNAIYTQQFSTTNVNISLGIITISTASRIATLSGRVINCNNTAVTNGYIIITNGNILTRHSLNNTGAYNVNKLICSYPTTTSLIGEDVTATQQSTPLTYIIMGAGANTVPDITACGVITQEFFNYTDNGTPYAYTVPIDSMYMFAVNNPTFTNSVYARTIPLSPSNYVTITFGIQNIGVGSITAISTFSTAQNNSFLLNPGGKVTITEYGAIGQFVAGTFTVSKNDLQTNTVHNYTGSFRIRRTN